MKKILLIISIITFLATNNLYAYTFGLKSQDNTIDNIVNIEDYFKIYIPIVGFIFDPWGQKAIDNISNLSEKLGKNRIYHITIAPEMYTAKQVADGLFDEKYKRFFDQIKKQDIRVIFRTMHEMNGGWYPWSGDPIEFKKAWIHVWNLSRQSGLDNHNILFDFSVNHWDMPSDGAPSQQAKLIECSPVKKQKNGCLSFEDYYPGDHFVDIVGVTFYNWGKGNSDRKWLTPNQILNDSTWKTLDRIKKNGKPIFIDEVGTSAVNYEGTYDYVKTLENFNTNRYDKNQRLLDLKDFLLQEHEIVGFTYFNVDYTERLMNRLIGEADWAVINMKTGKIYEKIFTLYNYSQRKLQENDILKLFNISAIEKYDNIVLVKNSIRRTVKSLDDILAKKYILFTKRIEVINKIEEKIKTLEIDNKTKQDLLEITKKTKELYEEYVK